MNGIAVDIFVLFLRGAPEGLLIVLALHVFTRTKIDLKKYLLLSIIYITATYLIRLLPIMLGVNTILSLFVLIISFQFIYNGQISKVIRPIVSAAAIFIFVATSEVINMLLLVELYGQAKAEELFTSKDGIIQSIYTSPSNVFFAFFIFLGYLFLKKMDIRKKKNGEAGKTICK